MEAFLPVRSGLFLASEAILAWTPVEAALLYDDPCWRETAGCVAVGALCERDRLAAAYSRVAPVSEAGEDGALRVLQLFNTLVLEHAMAPLVVHIALLDVVEYRRSLSPALADPGRPRRCCAEVVMLERFRPGADPGPPPGLE